MFKSSSSTMVTRLCDWKRVIKKYIQQERGLRLVRNASKKTVLQTDTGELVEYTQANKIIVSKELGKLIP